VNARIRSSPAARAAIGVRVTDGATAFTRIRSPTYVAAIAVVSALIAPFAAA
jgi:hypothetical protein